MAKYKMAIAYDFDGTLAKGNIQENSFLPELGIDKKKFWREVDKLSKEAEMDGILAYMFLLIDKAREKGIKYNRETIENHGKKVEYFEGVESWFGRINEYAHKLDMEIEHYIISSGIKEMIEGTSIAKHFEAIYASAFKYDGNDVPEWPAFAVNYTNKTQYLFRINKGIKNDWDNQEINKFTPPESRRIPFTNMVYIGDGETDVPAMKMVNYQGGYTIGLYLPNEGKEGKNESKEKVLEMLEHDRVRYMAEADYREKQPLEMIVQSVIDRIASRERVSKFGKSFGSSKSKDKPTKKTKSGMTLPLSENP